MGFFFKSNVIGHKSCDRRRGIKHFNRWRLIEISKKVGEVLRTVFFKSSLAMAFIIIFFLKSVIICLDCRWERWRTKGIVSVLGTKGTYLIGRCCYFRIKKSASIINIEEEIKTKAERGREWWRILMQQNSLSPWGDVSFELFIHPFVIIYIMPTIRFIYIV